LNDASMDVHFGKKIQQSLKDVQLAMMALRIKEKLTSTVEDHVPPPPLAMMVFKIKEKLALTVEDHVLHAQLAMMVFRTKEKLVLIVEDNVLRAKVKKQFANENTTDIIHMEIVVYVLAFNLLKNVAR